MIEPITNEDLPFGGDEQKLLDLLRGPDVGADDKIVGGIWNGLTPAQVLRDAEEYRRFCGE